jgi:uncharacterized protein YndB with AHSA1/START domain
MSAYDWSQFTKRIDINAPIAKIYEAWATNQGIESWFLRGSSVVFNGGVRGPADPWKPGDKYTWHWHGWSDDVVEHGTIMVANEKDEIQFGFGPEGKDVLICTVRIFPEQETTICQLTQTNIPTDEKGKTYYHLGCMGGWTFYLANLKSIMEGGIDLRNRNVALTNMVNS